MIDSLKTVAVSATGIGVTWIEWLPVAVRVIVGIASFIYICVKLNIKFNRDFILNIKLN